MLSKKGLIMLAILSAVTLFAAPSMAYDRDHSDHRDDRHYYHYHDRPAFGIRLSFVPDGAFTVRVGSGRYYYYDGLYYNRMGREYVLIAPPVGAVVAVIPSEYHPVVINGMIYYMDNGVYYVHTRHGYQVVPPPVMMVQPAPVVVSAPVLVAPPAPVVAAPPAAPAPVAVTDSFTVNIPDNKGGYMAVVIKKSGPGFVGPQGEYYSEFPKVTQLQAMYVK